MPPTPSKLTDEQKADACSRYELGERYSDLAKLFGVSESTIRKIIKRGPPDEKVVKQKETRSSMVAFAKRARSILWRQDGKDKKTFDAWRSRVEDLETNGGCTHEGAIIQASKDFKCLARLFREYDTSAHDPNPESHPEILRHGQPEPVDGITCEGKSLSHRENLAWAIEAAGKFLRTMEKPKTCPNDAAYFLYRQACDDPKEFHAKYTQVVGKPNEDEEAERKARTSGQRSIEEIDRMLDVLDKEEEREEVE